mmetsp:Transcript_12225/g.36116  ORF Transcript_12225/g.36116 Transcript_12225/m.36116 type:complete len:394 (-) Transcript_12225:262-1443(-)
MGDLYASALGVTVVRHRFIPARPRSYDGELVLLPPDKWGLAASDDPASAVLAVRDRLKCPPSIHVAVADGGAMKRWALRYPTHDAALAALRTPEAEAVEEAGGALFAAWNSRPYEERGWTTFESAVTTEVVARAAYFPRQHEALSRLPPKLIEIDEAPPRILHNLSEEGGVGEEQGAGPRIERIRARINAARFTGRGDREVVAKLYSDYITIVNNAFVASGEGVAGIYEGGRNDEGEADGRGSYLYLDGNVYLGEWRRGKQHGRGSYTYADGDVYEGEWQDGRQQGRGIYRFMSGDVYEGEYVEDKKHGRGTYRLADGRVMIGRFDNEVPVGEGVCWIPPDAESSDPDRHYWRAARLLDGQPEAYISLEEAEVIAKNVGEPLPAFGTHLQTAI